MELSLLSTERRLIDLIFKKKQTAASSDDELIRRVTQGDKEAFMVLYERYRERLFTYCCRMLGDRDTAKDALQDSFVKAFQNAAMYRAGTSVSAWLFRLTRNVCIDMLRARREHESIDDVEPVEWEQTSDVKLQEALTEEIERLPEIYREAVILRDVQGHSYQEIAEITGTAISTVKFRIFKARDMLRQRLTVYLSDL